MRLWLLRAAVFVGLFLLAAGLFNTQVLNARYYRSLSENNRIRLLPLEAPRGHVLDSQGRLLATNRASYHIIATPEDVIPEVFPELARLLQVPEKVIRQRMSAEREYPFAPVTLASDISKELLFKIEEMRPELPGISIETRWIRYYPYKEVASHLIGYLGKISPEEFQKLDRARYGFNSLIGRTGIEKIFDSKIRGWRGARQVEVNARGALIRIISEKAPVPGEDVVLSIDLEFQKRLSALIHTRKATIAFLDLKSNELLALVSNPGFDPNVFVSPQQSKTRAELLHDSNAPMVHRGISAVYPPGSIFKLVTAIAALERGKVTPHTTFRCPGFFRLTPDSRPFRCWWEQGHGQIDLYRALERSCNVYFYQVGKLVGPEALAATARDLGFGQTFKLELSNMVPGLVPDAAWKKTKYKEPWWPGETLSYAVGQGFLLVTPLQVLRLTSIIAKNGEWVEPKLVRDPAAPEETEKKKIAIHEENLRAIRQGMLKVVASDYGTGQLARVDFDQLAGKTGTAQAPPRDPHAWMTGFFPYNDPQIAFVVLVEHGGSGGITAARIVRRAIRIWKELNLDHAEDIRALPVPQPVG